MAGKGLGPCCLGDTVITSNRSWVIIADWRSFLVLVHSCWSQPRN